MFNKPEKVGNYTIIELLGQGSYGAVYLGEHVVTKHQAAIKVLRAILDAGTRAKFEKEARIIAQLSNPNSRHPHIVMLLDCRVDGDIPYLVMEYASSGNLRKTHPLGTQLPLALVVDYTRQIALALQHAHDQDVIHRDVKPENILVGRHGELLLSDFGIATVGQGTKNPLPQEPAGTYRYMAPEQTTNHELLRRSDQYSLGIVVYEWLAGTVPFDEEPWELPEKHAKEPPPSLLLKRPGLPSTVEQVVLKALAKDPNDRFPSVTAFAEALEEAAKAHEDYHRARPTPEEPSAPEQADWIPENDLPPLPVPSITPAAGEMSPPEQPANAPNDSPAPPTPDTVLLEDAPAPAAPARTPGADHPVQPAPGNPAEAGRPVEPAYSRPKAVGTPHRTYPRHHEPIVSIAYSPDGKRIAYETTSGGVHIWPISTGQPASHYQGSTGNWGKLHWSPNGTYLAALFGPGKHPTQAPLPDPAEPWKVAIPKLPAPALEVWYAATGNRVPLPPDLRDSTITTFAWSPTSPTLAIASGENVHIWNLTTESLVTYDTQADDVLALAWSPDGAKIASGDKGGKVLVWEPIARTTYFQYLGHRSSVQRIAWSPDDKRIASEETNGTIHFWDASKGVKQDEVRPHFFLASGRKSNAGLVEMAWSADGDWIALWEVHWGLQVLDAASRAPVAYHQGALSDHAVAWSPQESRLAVGISKTDQANAQVQIWEAGDWPIRHRFLSPPAETAVATLAWSPDGQQIASTVRGAQVQVWQADGYFPNPPEAGPKYIPPPPLTLTLRWKRLKHKEAALFISIGILLLLFGLIAALSPRGADDVIGWVAAGVGVIFLNIGLYRMWRNR